jgi:hypothetical protein
MLMDQAMMIKLKKPTPMKMFNDYPHEFKLPLAGKMAKLS